MPESFLYKGSILKLSRLLSYLYNIILHYKLTHKFVTLLSARFSHANPIVVNFKDLLKGEAKTSHNDFFGISQQSLEISKRNFTDV